MKNELVQWQQDLGKSPLLKVIIIISLSVGHMALQAQQLKTLRNVSQSFEIALPEREGPLTLGIFSPQGVLVRLLYRDASIGSIPSGLNGLIVSWDGRDSSGKVVPDGTYTARGLVHGPIMIFQDVEGNYLEGLMGGEIREETIIGLERYFSSYSITVRAAKDELLETRPFLLLTAMTGEASVAIAVDGLPIFDLSLQEEFHRPEITLKYGTNPGTALLTLKNLYGRVHYILTGLDTLVPLNAGTLQMPPDAFHSSSVQKESRP